MSNKTICLILGGGVGSRLYPLTQHRSKPAVPIGGKYKLIDIPIANCLHSNFNQIFVLTQYNAASLNQHLKNTYNFDAFSNRHVEILAAEQRLNDMNWYRGTADAVRQSLSYIDQMDYDHLLVLSGDQLYEMDLQEMLNEHVKTNAEITIATKPVTAKEATRFGIMKTNKCQRILSFIEKPAAEVVEQWQSDLDMPQKLKGKNYLASMGIYFFRKDAIHRLFSARPEALDFGKEIIPHAIENDYQVQSFLFDKYWEDIGTIRSYFDTNMELATGDCAYTFGLDKKIFTCPTMHPPSQIRDTQIRDVLLGEGCKIVAKELSTSVVGNLTRIGNKAVIRRTIILGNDFWDTQGTSEMPAIGIGENTQIENAIIDKNARIGKNVRIVGHHDLPDGKQEQFTVNSGIVIIHRNAVIPDNTLIGVEVQEKEIVCF